MSGASGRTGSASARRRAGQRGWSPGFVPLQRSPVPPGSPQLTRPVRGWLGSTTTSWRAGCWCRSSGGWRQRTLRRARWIVRLPVSLAPPDQLALQETVSGLKYELATAWTKHGKLAEENVRLREQLKAAQRSLALAAEQVRRLPAGADLNSNEVMLLQRLLTADPALDGPEEPATEAPSLLG